MEKHSFGILTKLIVFVLLGTTLNKCFSEEKKNYIHRFKMNAKCSPLYRHSTQNELRLEYLIKKEII